MSIYDFDHNPDWSIVGKRISEVRDKYNSLKEEVKYLKKTPMNQICWEYGISQDVFKKLSETDDDLDVKKEKLNRKGFRWVIIWRGKK